MLASRLLLQGLRSGRLDKCCVELLHASDEIGASVHARIVVINAKAARRCAGNGTKADLLLQHAKRLPELELESRVHRAGGGGFVRGGRSSRLSSDGRPSGW